MDLKIGEKVGEGSFSDLYEAIDLTSNRKVTVKIMRGAAAMLSTPLEPFKTFVQHENLVSVLALEKVFHPDSGELVDAIVMEHLSGDILAGRLRHHRFTWDEVTKVTAGLVSGVNHLQCQNQTHNGLDAENVIVSDPRGDRSQ